MARLTVVLDEQVLRDARRMAVGRGTSLSQLVRELLATMVQENASREGARRRLAAFVLPVGPISWKREELYQI